MMFIILTITILYLLFIGSFIYGFDKVPQFQLEDITPLTKFSVIIPFRNEAENLPILLASISKLKYPKTLFEVIFVDDESVDDSVEKIESYHLKSFNISVVKNIRNTGSPKKDAITTGINHSKFSWIVTTDADCSLPKFWLDTYDNYIQIHNPKLVIAPVTFIAIGSFLERFQLLDILSLQGVTIGSFGINKPFLCNGANLAYKKDVFNAVSGFEGNSHIASGDDVFLLEKILKTDKDAVHYVKSKDISVSTNPESNFKSLKSQRVRWASKTSSYNRLFSKLTALVVLFMNALLVCLPLLYFSGIVSVKVIIYTCVIKFLIDFLLIFKTARFFDQAHYLPSYFLSCLLYPFFSIYIALLSIFKGYRWKDRAYHK